MEREWEVLEESGLHSVTRVGSQIPPSICLAPTGQAGVTAVMLRRDDAAVVLSIKVEH